MSNKDNGSQEVSVENYRGVWIHKIIGFLAPVNPYVTHLGNGDQQWSSLENARKGIDRYLMRQAFLDKLK